MPSEEDFVSHWFNSAHLRASTSDRTPGGFSPSSSKVINTSSVYEYYVIKSGYGKNRLTKQNHSTALLNRDRQGKWLNRTPNYSFCVRKFLVQIVLLVVHSDIHVGLQWCDNYCSTWTQTGTLINFSTIPNKNSVKICKRAWVFMCRHIQTNKHSETKRHSVTTFHHKYAKKISGSSRKCYQSLFSVVEQLKSMPHLPNECSGENYTQLARLCNIKVKQEFELIMLDIKVIHVNIFINEPIKIMT